MSHGAGDASGDDKSDEPREQAPAVAAQVADVGAASGAVRVAWEKGGEATLVAIASEMVRLLSTKPSPPGSRLSGTVTSVTGAFAPQTLRIKVHGCRREGEVFRIDGRPIDLTRELLTLLRNAVPTA